MAATVGSTAGAQDPATTPDQPATQHPSISVGTTAPSQTLEPDTGVTESLDRPWVVIVWNDPINLMSYVAFVLRKLFGHSREKAHRLMMQVHTQGRATVSNGTRTEAERDVFRLHEHGLWATMQQD